MNKIKIHKWPDLSLSGSKRTNLCYSDWLTDWFVGYGKCEGCCFEGTWWDMICFARNILASENTKLVAPEFYHSEWANNNYLGEEKPYDFIDEDSNE